MRRHFEEGLRFDEAVRNIARNSPWWMISLVIHLVGIAVAWNIRLEPSGPETTAVLTQAALPETPAPLDEEIPIPPPEHQTLDPVETTPIETGEDDHAEDDVDQPFEETFGEQGVFEGPITGPSMGNTIGLGPGGGGPGGNGGRDRKRPRGQTPDTESSVDLGLRWLADHQDVDGGGMWDCDDFMKHDRADDRCDGAGKALYDPGVSGLALLAFLGAGYSDRGTRAENPFSGHVRAALRYLETIQDGDGCYGPRSSQHFMYNHAIAALAVSEAYWMTRSPRLRGVAQKGVDFLCRARNPYLAWRYEPQGGENDTSVTGWAVMALKSAKFAGLRIDPDAFEGARIWITKMTDPQFGQVGYNSPGGPCARPEGLQDRFPPEKSQAMTAVGVLTRVFLGEDPAQSDPIRKGTALMLDRLPRWDPEDGSIDMYYWYYATLAMFQVGGEPWKRWNSAMKSAILDHQHRKGSGSRAGSWDPIDPWGADGGRVYSTASMVLCLEVYYRYDRVIGTRAESGR